MKGKRCQQGPTGTGTVRGTEVENVHHALQSVIYNAKKRLEKAGLPDVNYIEIRNGVVYWNDEIKVQEDATEFDQIYNRIKHEKNPDKR